jgi:hypothetical protein
MSKRFLSGIKSDYVTELDDPIFPTDAANKQWVEALISLSGFLPAGGTTGQKLVKLSPADYDTGWVADTVQGAGHATIHGGFFTSPNNASIHGGFF